MQNWYKRITGIILAVAAAGALVFCLVTLVRVQQAKEPLSEGILESIDLVDDTLATTQDGLLIVDDALDNTSTTLEDLKTAALAMAQSVHDTSLMADSFVPLLQDELPTTITNTQVSLTAAQSSAVVIDSFLLALSKIPLLGEEYQQEMPLSTALGQVSNSLSTLPQDLKDISVNLANTSANLLVLETQIAGLRTNISATQENLSEAGEIIDTYQEDVRAMRAQLAEWEESAPGIVAGIVRVAIWLILCLCVALLGTLVQGCQMALKHDRTE
ncbi:MAG: hypothetical protein JW726_14540 [Anaerolineales bacterium]|nr:hypothetical protein [Anaerolineales bacterium]